MQQTYLKLCLVLSFLIGLNSCNSNKFDIDLSKIEVETEITRFEDIFFSLNSENIAQKWPIIRKEHPELAEFVATQMFQAFRGDSMVYSAIIDDINDTLVQRIYRDTKKKFSNISIIEKRINNAFKRFRYYFPNDTIPKVYTFITLSPVQAFTYPGIAVISLDRFLGPNYNYPTSTPNYMRVRMREEFVSINLLKTFFDGKYPEDQLPDGTLLDRMIREGKKLYFLDAMLPELDDTLKIEYSKKQLEWCFRNEYQIYDHMVKEDLFYKTDHLKTDKYLHEAPFTQGNVPPETPPRIGKWFGWQVVRHYMDNTKTTLPELMAETDYKSILKKARYKP